MVTAVRKHWPTAAVAGGGAAQIVTLSAAKACPGHQAGILLLQGTFVATRAHMRAEIDWAASVLGGSKCSLTFHVGKITPNGSRISRDIVDRTTTPISQGAMPGVTDYREKLFPGSIDAESAPGSSLTIIDLPGLTLGATYTFEIKWGFVAGARMRGVGAIPTRIAVDDLAMRCIVSSASGGGPSVMTIGTWPGWQVFPGYYEYDSFGAFATGYEPTQKWALTAVGLTPLPSTFGVAFALQAAGRRFLAGCLSDNKLHLVDPITAAVIVSQAVAFAADPYDLAFYPGTAPAKAVVATDDSNLRIMSVADAGISQDSAIAVGVAGRACATNQYTGTSVAVWHGSRGVNPIKLRGYRVSDNLIINGTGLTLEAATGDVRRILRIPNGPNIDTLLVATSRGKVYHVSKDGTTILGTWTHPDGVVDLSDIGVGPNGVLCYVIDAAGPPSEFHYFWLPNTVGGSAYLHFDSSGAGASIGLAIAIDSCENVLLAGTNNVLIMIPGGSATCNPTSPISGEHLTVTFIES